jgi:hypothetical protein
MPSREPNIAVLLPPAPQPGVVAGAFSLVRSLSEKCGVRVVVGLPRTAVDDWESSAACFGACAASVSIRTLTWTELPRDVVIRMFGSDLDMPSEVSSIQVPHDRAWSFADCSGWILFGDTTLGATAWLRPAIVIAPQLAERYTPAFAGQQDVERRIDTFLSWRSARAVLGTTVADRRDLVSYAGMHPDRVRPRPPFDDVSLSTVDQVAPAMDSPAIIWHPAYPWPAPATTAAIAWREYLETGGRLQLLIVGRHADAVASAPSVASILDDCSRIGGRWHTRATLPGRRLDRLLDSARILWNPTVADDSHWLVARSLARGIPAVVADAPHMRDGFQGDITSIPKLWTYPADDIVAAAAALSAASTAPTVKGAPSLPLRPDFTPAVAWRETLDALQLDASED